MNRIVLLAIISLVANVALATVAIAPAPIAATKSQEAACPAAKRSHVIKINVNPDGSFAHAAVVKMDQSGETIVIHAADRPKAGWFMCGPVKNN